jgi:hypothetical protein
MIETAVVLDRKCRPVYWHLPPNRSGGAIPDSRTLWDVLWEHRMYLEGVAHSHPGSGQPGPSAIDVSTFSAVELALGQRLNWYITSSNGLCVVTFIGPEKYHYYTQQIPRAREPAWADRLRQLSVDEAQSVASKKGDSHGR